MILPVMTAIVIVFIVWINYEIHKTSMLNKDDTETFWNHEKASNIKPGADISSLDYITISAEKLPMSDNPDQTVNSYRDIILGLSGKKALNLCGYTNTDLKLLYGVANITILSEYDNNYTVLVSILHKWAERLYNLSFTVEALEVLEYAVSCHTDVLKSYLLLAGLYKSNHCADKIPLLINSVQTTKIRDKEKLVNKLYAMMNS